MIESTYKNWKNCYGDNISIAILDSGIDINRSEFKNSKITVLNDCTDRIGHGTAVTSIVAKIVPQASIFCYNLFENKDEISSNDLIEILNEITEHKHFDLIHLSCGVVICDNVQTLYNVCKKITDSGSIIVAAFDNEGSISYPAIFDNVIGVDWCKYCTNGMEYYATDGSPINIMGTGLLQRLPWKDNEYKYVAGSSFAAPYITSIIAKMLDSGIKASKIQTSLKINASRILKIDNSNYQPLIQKVQIKKAIILPFNKEIQTLSAFEDMLIFNIEGIYDYPLFGHVGEKCRDLTGYGGSTQIVKSINDIVWDNDFDTVIIGHVDIITKALKKDILQEIIRKCIKFRKNLYSFDDIRAYKDLTDKIEQNGNFVFFPKTDVSEVDKSLMGKLYNISTPVIAVFGTSPKQGKFSLQLEIRKKMKQLGYKVGGLGTEPSALLFGLDRVYPIGYGSVHISGKEAIQIVNRYMHEIDCNENDVIIVGSQSQTIPYNTGNIGHYPLAQHELFIGTNPDVILLCINPYDDPAYISRTVQYLECYLYSKVLALVLFVKHKDLEWAVLGTQFQELDRDTLELRKSYYIEKIKLPCYIAGVDLDLDSLIENITDYFS